MRSSVRAIVGVRGGDAISPWYDPMIAKVIVHGPTRATALAGLRAALAGTQVEGCTTNVAFLHALATHPGFAAGQVDTGLIGRDLAALTAPVVPDPAEIAVAAVVALAPAGDAMAGFALWGPLWQRVTLARAEARITAQVATLGPGRYEVDLGASRHPVEGGAAGWTVDGRRLEAVAHRSDGAVHLHGARRLRFAIPDPLAVADGPGQGAGTVLAPMPGLVKAVFVTAGQAVAQGDRLAILEAMKMEHVLSAGRDGAVAEVLVAPGAQVEAGAALIRLEDEG